MRSYLRVITMIRCFKIGLVLFVVFCVVGLVTPYQLTAKSPVPSPGLLQTSTLTPTPTPLTMPPQVDVVIEGFAFKPATLNISIGTTVIWHNNDSQPHTVSSPRALFDSGNFSRGATFSYIFEQKGIFEYSCTIHSYMKGKIFVDSEAQFLSKTDGKIIDPLLASRLIVILGIVNLVGGVLIFFSCRCLGGSKLGVKLMKYRSYQRFYQYHCYIWRVFWASVIIHASLAIIFFGWPS
ncbi:MAG: hypothetical protein CL873_02700 [Dehalococcoidales bacterium]|nr:hypothetical protein [Dehalococcoidales bacterium]